jgi:hydroxyacylglutathione hydrolase
LRKTGRERTFSCMILKRIYDETLAQASYLVGCEKTGSAIVVDPNRDIERYLAAAQHEHLRIEYVTETHIHADFASGARELAKRTGASLLLSAEGGGDWLYRFAAAENARLLRDGDVVDVGEVKLDVRHTPGHTPEHIAFLATDRATSDSAVGMFSGDFIFVGDVGRPDLLERAANARGTMEGLAKDLYSSIAATASLPDYLQIWPGHGAGSACGKALGALPSTTLGYERIANWAFKVDDESRFVREVLAGQPEAPKYFAMMKAINRDGVPPVPTRALAPYDLPLLRRALSAGTTVIDARSTADFAAGHIPGTLNLPTGTSFTTWAGSLLPYNRDVVILADDPARIERARLSLTLIGLDRAVGYAGADVRAAWASEVGPLERVTQISVQDLVRSIQRTIIDVRSRSEWNAGHLPNASHHYLGDLVEQTKDLPRETPLALHCQGGTRSAIAASLMQARGFTNVANVRGGYRAWETAGLPTERDDEKRAQADDELTPTPE